jgi:hypothetical protein
MALMTYKLTRLKCLNEGITSKLQKERWVIVSIMWL